MSNIVSETVSKEQEDGSSFGNVCTANLQEKEVFLKKHQKKNATLCYYISVLLFSLVKTFN